ncbi:MAG: ATP synthase subunit I [Gammaproteobacteria bacterium]
MNAVIKILLAQTGLTVLAGIVALGLVGRVAGYSAVLGGLVGVIPSAFLGARMMAVSQSGNPRKMLNATYVGEAFKWLLTFGLFLMVYLLVEPLNAGALLAGFIVVQAGVWVAIVTDKQALTR